MFYLIEIDLSIEQLFLLNIAGAESKNEALAVQMNTLDLDSYDNFRLFHTFSNVMSRNLLVPYPERAKAIKKKQKFSKNSNFCRLHILSGCLSMMKSKISEPCAYLKYVNKK